MAVFLGYRPSAFLKEVFEKWVEYFDEKISMEVTYNKTGIAFLLADRSLGTLSLDALTTDENNNPVQSFKLVAETQELIESILNGLSHIMSAEIKNLKENPLEKYFYFDGILIPRSTEELEQNGVEIDNIS